MKVAQVLTVVFTLLALRCGEEALEVSICQPEDGTVVSGILRIAADASDNAAAVSFYVDDSLVHCDATRPFSHVWNTFGLPDSATHAIHAVAEDRKGNEAWSDTVSVDVFNGNVLFADNFEAYSPYSYPAAGWFEIWPGAGGSRTCVAGATAHSGTQSFMLCGTVDQVRTDGTELDLLDISRLTYELNIMIPSADPAGAIAGFFYLLNPLIGTIFNGIWFRLADNVVYARGIAEDSTGVVWSYDTWYTVRVELDYPQLRMDVWLNDEQIVFDLPATPREWADTFALATEYGTGGTVYYDDVAIFEGAGSESHPIRPSIAAP
ncbi:Ig-like domain-containing protein [candidate division WOR-3 bacterium]|nr:Ig-like domain-containing protein [candidate division WOR-3 bacterium]